MNDEDSTKGSKAFGLLIFAVLLAGDVIFFTLHGYHTAGSRFGSLIYDISVDGGLAEHYQFLKYIFATGLLLLCSSRLQQLGYIAWSLFFIYFLLDDWQKWHERAGNLIERRIPAEAPLGLQWQDLGEIAFLGANALILCGVLAVTYVIGDARFRRFCLPLAAIMGLLVFFGVCMDFVHAVARPFIESDEILIYLEDGGEMVAISLAVAYLSAFLALVSTEEED